MAFGMKSAENSWFQSSTILDPNVFLVAQAFDRAHGRKV